MADEKYAKSKCFIFSPDGYEEITYSELCRRRDTDTNYQNRKFIPLHGMLMEVAQEQYAEFYRAKKTDSGIWTGGLRYFCRYATARIKIIQIKRELFKT